MPSMSTSHGGVLYYVVKVPKQRPCTPDRTPSSLFLDEKAVTSTPISAYQYQKINGDDTDSGWDNPFRPDGDLSKEADEIVELIREGKPITPTQNNPSSKLPHDDHDASATLNEKQNLTASPKGTKANGTANLDNSAATGVEVQRGTIAPTDGTQVEHVVIKKKPKCKCCSIQ